MSPAMVRAPMTDSRLHPECDVGNPDVRDLPSINLHEPKVSSAPLFDKDCEALECASVASGVPVPALLELAAQLSAAFEQKGFDASTRHIANLRDTRHQENLDHLGRIRGLVERALHSAETCNGDPVHDLRAAIASLDEAAKTGGGS